MEFGALRHTWSRTTATRNERTLSTATSVDGRFVRFILAVLWHYKTFNLQIILQINE